MTAWLTLVGLGEDGWEGLGEPARRAVREARLVLGGERHLKLIPAWDGQERAAWPHPFTTALENLLARRGSPVCVLASGDPMHYGLGATLARSLDEGEMRVFSAPSSFALAAARLGWAMQDCVPLTVHGRPLALVQPHLVQGARLLILSENGATPAALAQMLVERGFGASGLTVLEHMGGPLERRVDGTAATWAHPEGAALNVVGVRVVADPGASSGWSTLAGLPEEAFHHDGQITKRDVRAMTLAHLGPRPGELLWDVGAGCGSIGIEWMRAHPRCRAIAIEDRADRRTHIEINRDRLGVPGLQIVAGSAPAALAGLAPPDAIFIGGGLTDEGVFDACWAALPLGGRLVANAVTLQSEARVAALHDRLGGTLTRVAVAQARPLGGFDGWRCAMPVTIFTVTKV
ncbi:bifunctional cobalt-precorrin-7 (C(5))-methyltransferase/cobalt-precorrin-6B (C(15))-methyltransferase [Pararhodospirillum photometricum]|uniref:CobL n=1 Tax=Pararhodospirillum photometricum DSM 122 TaxID=1150469 RepID=H6SPY7_PARPM|nr:bifunctional cobalt-precorrin-7 (C(5))-methyltransferase/cobalt-precorrin-6B (C(15))-methyltransferase [Pararhodospirillum photometricum]CCG07257.1 CobL [Pararhodospirillum photometricum DSM 122]